LHFLDRGNGLLYLIYCYLTASLFTFPSLSIEHHMKVFLKYMMLLIFLAGCEEESPIVNGFQTHEVLVTESSGITNVIVDLGEGLNSTTTFTIAIHGTAGMEGDFLITNLQQGTDLGNGVTKVTSLETSVTTSSQVQYVALPGQKTITIPIKIIDDSQVEVGYETIQLEITDISGADLTITNSTTTILIADTDVPQTDNVQIDLSWILQSGGSINNSNFDLYLVKNVKFTSSGTTFDLVTGISSTRDTGFESLLLDELLPNEQYYVLIKYVSGSSIARITLVISQGEDIRSASGQVNSSQTGTNLFFGPITKSSSGYTYRQQNNGSNWIGMIGN
jgi:hypothetical protein